MSRYQEMMSLNKALLSDKSHGSLDSTTNAGLVLQLVQQWVREAFIRADDFHGLEHAQAVEKNVASICKQMDIQVSEAEKLVLRTAALLHDVGFALYSQSWSKDRREHVKASLVFAVNKLPKVPIFSTDPAMQFVVYYLIAHHDDRNYKYPSMILDGEVKPVELGEHAKNLSEFEASLSQERRRRLQFLLSILAEADALCATGIDGAKRTFNYSIERGLPPFAQGNPLNAWCWEESALGNVRLAAKGALTEAFNLESKRLAWKEYEIMEQFVKEKCTQYNMPYYHETLMNLRDDTISPDDPQFKVKLKSYLGWEELEGILRKVTLLGDKSLYPYSQAKIVPQRYSIRDLWPTSLYVLQSQIEQHRKLQAKLLSEYALSLFDLTGIIEYNQNGDSFRLSPPIVETYYEPKEKAIVSAIVDGLHRIWLARELGINEIWVIEISGIPDKFPLVPLPLSWNEVRMVAAVPPTYAKREFRFPTIESFPDVSDLTQIPITPENYLYFFYRDLNPLGSSGIRSSK